MRSTSDTSGHREDRERHVCSLFRRPNSTGDFQVQPQGYSDGGAASVLFGTGSYELPD